MPITAPTMRKQLRELRQEMKAAGLRETPWTKPELLAIFNAILAVWEDNQYRNGISSAIDGAKAGLTNAQKKKLHEAAMRLAIKEDLL